MNIKILRAKYNLSQKELSENTGIPKGRINGWEQRGTTPKEKDMEALRSYFASLGESEINRDEAIDYYKKYVSLLEESYTAAKLREERMLTLMEVLVEKLQLEK